MTIMSILSDEIEHQGGGFCPNSTTYCSFGCCGDHENQGCCFPIGVFIGCGFGALGTICLLISIFRCRLRNHGTQQHRLHRTDPETNFGPEFGRDNPTYPAHTSPVHSITQGFTGGVEFPKYSSYLPPPSYEAAMAGLDGGTVIQLGNT